MALIEANGVVHYRSDKSRAEAEETAKLVEAEVDKAALIQQELDSPQSIESLFQFADKEFGRLGLLVNIAGKVLKKPLVEFTEEEYDETFSINAKVPFFAMQSAAKRTGAGGRIINIGTTILGATTGLYSVYAGSKAPLEDFTRALAKEIGPKRVTADVIAPGPMVDSWLARSREPQQSGSTHDGPQGM